MEKILPQARTAFHPSRTSDGSCRVTGWGISLIARDKRLRFPRDKKLAVRRQRHPRHIFEVYLELEVAITPVPIRQRGTWP